MHKKQFIVILILIASCVGQALAQDVELTVSAPNVVALGEQFRIVYKINARPQEFKPPAFDGFYILAGPSTSSSSSVQIINGKMTQTHEISYTYILEATTEGKINIDPAAVMVSKKEYSSQTITIDVVKGTVRQPQAQQQRQHGAKSSQTSTEQAEEDIFVAVEFDRTTAYRGQPILATVRIYTRQNITGFDDVKFPAFNGFWSQDVETPNHVEFQRVNINGRIFNAGVLKKYLLFAQRTGDIPIEPFEIVILMQQRGARSQSMFDEFFGTYQTVRRRLVSKPTVLKIRDLPPNAPASFTGAVGQYNLEASLDKTEVKTNEAVNLKVRVAGSGNLRLIETPKFAFPAGFEVFDPKTTDRINTTSQGASGSKNFEFVAIPRVPGTFEMGTLDFTYFDPTKEKYITLKSKPLSIKVEADGTEPSTMQMVGSFGKEDIRFIGQDVRFIKTEGYTLTTAHSLLFGSIKFYMFIILIVFIFIGLFIWISYQKKLRGNVALVRTKKANKMARKRLKQAQRYLYEANNEKFYEELLKALWGYVSDKLSIPVANLTSDNVRDTLLAHNVSEEDTEEFVSLVSLCEYARFAPVGEQQKLSVQYENALALIARLDGVIVK